ncbi:protein NUCLEAR FUSION DEFECTIVE 4 [Tripterygium wilfordii]|uniref:Protein NUCLEAR FUSION DEFECTIVE 4 n=1 Tax=Tripterygium wilfordii TaxID=458696 RepID=A0A7J7CYG9_TRIWF|nr:protein NUCLEAR FUSION DEFECTIVE 4 [Tripterygium wilfordii]KAF5739058.1 protein NUCLEAR FUSION DEFECTIVE 4 [Tripterygium wilfordii]
MPDQPQVLKAGSRPPWVGLAAAVWVQISAGNGYNFPLYSSAIKSVLGFTQQQITILGVANDFGESVGILPGIACNKFPIWSVLLVGVVACFLGYGVLWLAITETVQGLPYWVLWIALVIATNSNAWFGTAVLVTNMRNFPFSRGTVSGILKGYVGLAAAVYTVVYNMVLKDSASKLMLFLAIGIPILCLALMYFIRPCTPASGETDSSEDVHFVFTQIASVILGIYLVIVTITSDLVSLSDVVSYLLVAIMVILLLSPLGIPIKMTLFPANTKKKQSSRVDSSDQLADQDGNSTQYEPLLAPSSSETHLGSFNDSDDASDMETLLAVGEGAVVKKKRRPRRGEDFKFREAFIKADFWLLWIVYFLGVGSGVTVLNNLGQIGIAFGVDDTTILLCIFSFCNFAGRLGAGVVSEHFVRSKTLPRTFWMTCTLILMVITFVLYALALNGTLYISTALLGVCYGVQYSIMVPTVSELFGLKHFGVIYNFMLLGNPIGALLFSGILAGYVYDAEAAVQGSSICLGPNCFRLTFLVLAGICGLGTILSIILTVRIRPVYQMLYAGGSFRLPQTSGH